MAVAAAIVEHEPRVRHRRPAGWSARLARLPRVVAFCHAIWALFPTTGAAIVRTAAIRDSSGDADADSSEDLVLGVSAGLSRRIELHEHPGRRTADQLEHAAAVRRRIGKDPHVPGWARTALPLVAAIALVVLAPLARAVRRTVTRSVAT